MEIAFDDRGLVPVVVQDWSTGEVLTLAYANAEAVQATRDTGELHLWSRSRDELWHKGATSGNTQARPRAAPRLRRRRAAGAGRARRPRLPHRRAHLLPQRRPRAARAARGAARARAHARATARATGPRAPTPSSCSTTRRCIGEKVMEEAEEVARAAREESDERVDDEAADVLYHLAVLLARPRALARRRRRRCSLAVAADSSLADARRSTRSARSRATTTSIPLRHTLHRRLRDAGQRVPEAARATPSSRRSCWSRPSAASRSAATRSSASGPARCSAGRWATRATRTRSPTQEVAAPTPRRRGPTRRRSPAARSASSATTSCARSRRRSASRTRTRSACPTWR